MTEQKIKFPFGAAEVIDIEDAATSLVEISNTKTILRATAGFGQAVTGLSLSAEQGLLVGSQVFVDIQQGATGRNVTFGSAGDTIVGAVLTGVALDRDVLVLEWNGSEFVAQTAAWNKIVDAA